MRMVPALALLLSRMSLEHCGVLAGLVVTRPELKADVGDSVLLECVFLSLVAGDWNMTKVDWLHLPENNTQTEMVFYYYSNHSVPAGRFQHRVQWLGDVSRKNGSIKLQGVQMNDSGMYTCEIRVLGRSSVFKNYTMLYVASAGQKLAGFAGTLMGCLCAAIFLALLLGYGRKKFLKKQRPTENGTVLQIQSDDSRDEVQEAIFSLPSCPEILKGGQEAELHSRKDSIYITMRPSATFQEAGFAPVENNVYVQLERKKIPVEWMDERRLGDEGAQQSEKTCEKSGHPEEEVSYGLGVGKYL